MPETKVKKETDEQKEKKAELSAAMPITVKNDSTKEIELAFKGEMKAVKVGASVSGEKQDFSAADLFRVGRIKGVDINTSGGSSKKAAKKAAKE